MPHFDDIIPYVKKRAKDVADKVEEKRQQIDMDRKQRRIGTLVGLEDLILKRKQEAQNAQRNRD